MTVVPSFCTINQSMASTVGLFGPRGAGKNFISKKLWDAWVNLRIYDDKGNSRNRSVYETSFAKPIKSLAQYLFGFSDKCLYGSSEERNQVQPHWTEENWLKSLGETYWKAALLPNIPENRAVRELVEDFFAITIPKPQILGRYEAAELTYSAYKAFTPRDVLKFFGEGMKAKVGPDFWIKQLSVANTKDITVVTDGRSLAEAQHIKNHGGRIVRIYDPDGETLDDHPTEKGLLEIPDSYWDLKVRNSPIKGLNLEDFSSLTWFF